MKYRIVVVDDSFYMRTVLKNMLTDAGFNVIGEASDGQSAIALAKEMTPDLITLDLILPDNTGLDVLKSIKSQNAAIKVVIVSAVGQESIVNEAIRQGAEAYIVKPFAEEKVVEILNNVLEGQHIANKPQV